MNRTLEEILARIEKVTGTDYLNDATTKLILYLPYGYAKPYVKKSTTEKEWGELAQRTPKEDIVEYLPFAWEKANNCRGLSASRSLSHMRAWLWLDGKDDKLIKELDNYEYYGKPQLVMISELYEFDWRAQDNGCWVESEYGQELSEEKIALIGSHYTRKAEAHILKNVY